MLEVKKAKTQREPYLTVLNDERCLILISYNENQLKFSLSHRVISKFRMIIFYCIVGRLKNRFERRENVSILSTHFLTSRSSQLPTKNRALPQIELSALKVLDSILLINLQLFK